MSDINVLLKIIHHTVVLKKTSLVLGAERRPSPPQIGPPLGSWKPCFYVKYASPPPSSSGFVISAHLGGEDALVS